MKLSKLLSVQIAILMALTSSSLFAELTPKAAEQIKVLLDEFLSGAGANNLEAHERFWSENVLYTSATGTLRTKAEILKAVREDAAKPVDPKAPKMTYAAEDVTIHEFGNCAVVNFRLVAKSDLQGKIETSYYRNTGTFHMHDGKWSAVGWQATRIEEAKK